ncbi:MAG: 50S ribosomal protein L11 [Wigglesworthia glossinidia]|nr:50S ribosomal protein L11 [Wigglesworthia glossinidia]
MKKNIKGYIKLQIKAGSANPSPPIGPALGQQGINIIKFCKSFNNQTSHIDQDTPIPVIISVYNDRTFSFVMKTPPTSFFLKKLTNIKSGSSNSKEKKIGTVSFKQIQEIAKKKEPDMTGKDLNAISQSIIGTAKSMGFLIED